MKNLTTSLLVILLVLSVCGNIYQHFWPDKVKIPGETVYLPGEKESTIVYKLPSGAQSETINNVDDYDRKKSNAKKLIASVKGIPDLENEKRIQQLIASNMKLELNLTEANMTLNDKDNQIKSWSDKYNSITVNNATNKASAVAEISPKIVTTEKREKFYLPKESYTIITSDNTSARFYGSESYVFKNPKQKDFLELNIKAQGLYLNKNIVPYSGVELIFNPDGKLKVVGEYGYFLEKNKGYQYWTGGIQFNLIRF